MITVEASNIYFGGGFVLLKELLDRLDGKAIAATVYVSYPQVAKELEERKYQYISVARTGSFSTVLRYLKKGNNSLYFCSLPPFVSSCNSIVYAHNPHVLQRPRFDIQNLKYWIYYYWVYFFKGNVDLFACQTESVSLKLQQMGCRTRILPFYTQLQNLYLEKEYDFCYVSTVAPHKNHERLFEAIEKVMTENAHFRFAVTIRNTPNNASLIARINEINDKAEKEVIVNCGFVSRMEMERLLSSTKTLFFPSLKETFGLPLVEAIGCGLRILVADRPYVYDVINNPIVFDPLNVDSMKEAMLEDLKGKNDNIVQSLIIDDKMEQLIDLLNK